MSGFLVGGRALEKINDERISCMVDAEDLTSQRVRIKDLAYGTEAAQREWEDDMKSAHILMMRLR